MSALDFGNPDSRLLPCARCGEPVASSAWSGRVVLRCGYCGFEDERELILEQTAIDDAPYRDRAKSKEHPKLTLALGAALGGRTMETIDDAMLASAIGRTPLLPEDLPSVEWERVWLGVWLAIRHAVAGRYLQARVVLEHVLDNTKTPAYRGILLAHLAQHAAARKAIPLAKKWLRARPDVAVAEVESEIDAARAMILLVQDRTEEVIERTGPKTAGAGFSGFASFLAVAMNIEARERRGDHAGADAIWESIRKSTTLTTVLVLMSAHGFGDASMKRTATRWRRRSTVRSAGFVALGVVIAGAARGLSFTMTALFAFVAVIFDAVATGLTAGRFPKHPRVSSVLSLAVPALAAIGGGLLVMRFHPVTPTPPPAVSASTAVSSSPKIQRTDELVESAQRAADERRWDDATKIAERCLELDSTNAECRRIAALADVAQQLQPLP